MLEPAIQVPSQYITQARKHQHRMNLTQSHSLLPRLSFLSVAKLPP
jgi:hypothetical protein